MTASIWIIEQRCKRKGARWKPDGCWVFASYREAANYMTDCALNTHSVYEYRAVRYVREETK